MPSARRWLREAVVGLEEHDPAALLSWAHALAGTVEAQCGAVPAARHALGRAGATRKPAVTIYSAEVSAAEAWTQWAEGRLSAAIDTMIGAAVEADSAGLAAIAAEAWHNVGRIGAPDRALGPTLQLAPALDGPLPAAYRRHLVGLVDGDGSALDDAADAFVRCGAHLLAAEASMAAAQCHGAAGRRSAELASRAHGDELARACAGATTVPSAGEDAALGRLDTGASGRCSSSPHAGSRIGRSPRRCSCPSAPWGTTWRTSTPSWRSLGGRR